MRYREAGKWLLFFVLAATTAAQKDDVKLPDGPGKALVERVCSGCHGLESVVRARNTKERWNTIVDDMVSRGATATDDEADQIVNYLAANFSKPKPPEEKKP
jgi:mono/diheme cytochrome c family protein